MARPFGSRPRDGGDCQDGGAGRPPSAAGRRPRAGMKRRFGRAAGRGSAPPSASRRGRSRSTVQAAKRRAGERAEGQDADRAVPRSARMRAASGRTIAQRPSTTCTNRPPCEAQLAGQARAGVEAPGLAGQRAETPPPAGPSATWTRRRTRRDPRRRPRRASLPPSIVLFVMIKPKTIGSVNQRACRKASKTVSQIRVARLQMKSSAAVAAVGACAGARRSSSCRSGGWRSAPRGGCARRAGGGRR